MHDNVLVSDRSWLWAGTSHPSAFFGHPAHTQVDRNDQQIVVPQRAVSLPYPI